MSSDGPAPERPRPYEEWRSGEADRREDAAYLFGYYLIEHCRTEALRSLTTRGANEAIDAALHNVMDLLEGFWRLDAGRGVTATLALRVDLRRDDEVIESIEISPGKLDLPVGYWAWRDGQFRGGGQ